MIGDNFEWAAQYDNDYGLRPFKIRVGGTGESVSLIDPEDEMRCPLGRVELVVGRDSSPVSSFSFTEVTKR